MMDRLEDLVRESLSAHADDAPDGLGLLDAVSARTTRRRRRAWLATTGAAAAVVAIVAGVVVATSGPKRGAAPAGVTPPTSGPTAGPTPTPSPTPTAALGATQVVSYHGVEVSVPAAWKINDAKCGTPLRDTVLIEAGAVEACAVGQPPGLTVVRLIVDDSPLGKARAAVATHDVTVDGEPARRGVGVPEHQTTPLAVLDLPGPGVVVSVESPDQAKAQTILDSVKVVSVDNAGCVTHVDSLTAPAPNVPTPPATPLGGEATQLLVPGSPTSASVCMYDDDWIGASKVVPADQVASLVATLNALPRGVSQPGPGYSEGPAGCADDTRRGFIVRFTYAHVGATDVYVHIAGCDGLSASTSWRTTKINATLVDFLLKQTGYYGGFPNPQQLR